MDGRDGEGCRGRYGRDLIEIAEGQEVVPAEEPYRTIKFFVVAGGARGIGRMVGDRSEEVIGHHRQFIDDYRAEVLVPREEHIDVGVLQGSLTANPDVSAGVKSVASRGVGDPVLEGHAEEFVPMLPLECFSEGARDPFDHSTFARSWRAVAKAQQRALCCGTSRIILV